MKKVERVHPDDKPILAVLRGAARAAAKEFELYLHSVEHKWNCNPGKSTGICYVGPGRIAVVIRFWNFPSNCVRYRHDGPAVKTPQPGWWKHRLPTEYVVDTLAHEIAHLRYVHHGYAHRGFTEDVLIYLKELPSIQRILALDPPKLDVPSTLNPPAGPLPELTLNT